MFRLVPVAVVLFGLLAACSTADSTAPEIATTASPPSASTTSTSPSISEVTTTSAAAEPTGQAFDASPSEFEARVELFGEAVGVQVGTFAPIEGSQVIGAQANDHAVGYYLDEGGRIVATATFVPIDPGQTQFTTPAQVVSIVATAPVSADDLDAAVEVFRREVLDDLSTLDSTVKVFSGGPPFFRFTSAIEASGVLYISQPPDQSEPPISELARRLSTLVK